MNGCCQGDNEPGWLLLSYRLLPTYRQRSSQCYHQQKRQHLQALSWHIQQPELHQ